MNTILDENKLNSDYVLQEFGVHVDYLKETGDLERMLNLGRSSLITAYPFIGGICFPLQCKLSLREKSDGSLAIIPHPIRKEPELNEYRGHKFTKQERDELLSTGKLEHPINIYINIPGMDEEVYLFLDKETNEIISTPKNGYRKTISARK